MAGPPASEAAPRSARRETQRRLARVSPAARAHLAATVALGLASTALVIAQATLLAHVVARVFLGGAAVADVASSLWWLAAVSVGPRPGRRGLRSERALRRCARHGGPARAARAPSAAGAAGDLHDEHAGELAATAVQGVDSLEAYFARYLPQAILSVLAPPLILIWVLPRNWESAAILAVTVPLIPVFMVLIGMAAEQRARRRWRMLAALGARFLDVVSGLETLRAFGREHAAAQAIDDAGRALPPRDDGDAARRLPLGARARAAGDARHGARRGHRRRPARLRVARARGRADRAHPRSELYAPLRELGAQYHAGADGLAGAERILEVLDAARRRGGARAGARCPRSCARRRLADRRGLRVRRTRRADPRRRRASRSRPGATTALVGPSGAGKTTLARIVARLADPQSGTVACDGVDLRHVDPRAWRARVAWVQQRATLFAGTVEDNVRLARPGASSARGGAGAARRGRRASSSPPCPTAPRTRVGDGGRRLSAGQSRRIALARAFLDDAPLVVLDEPTAHLDPESAAAIEAAIARLAEGRTVLLVTHRPSWPRAAIACVELRDGRIAAARESRRRRWRHDGEQRRAVADGGGHALALAGCWAPRRPWPPARCWPASGCSRRRATSSAARPSAPTSSRSASRSRPSASLAIARAALRYGERLVSHELAFRTLADLRRRFFDRLVPLVPAACPASGARNCSAASSPTSTACRTCTCGRSLPWRWRSSRGAPACSSPFSWRRRPAPSSPRACSPAASSSRA